MAKEELKRFSDIIQQEDMLDVLIVGAGGIGSALTRSAIQMGVGVHVVDFDVVEPHNRGTQGFGLNDLGKKKIEVMAELYDNYGYNQYFIAEDAMYKDGLRIQEPVLFLATDSIASRDDIFKKLSPNVKFIIDGRMAAESGQIFFVDINNRKSFERYEKTFFSPDETEGEACTAKATIYCGNYISSMMLSTYKALCISLKNKLPLNAIPFYQQFDLRLFDNNVEF